MSTVPLVITYERTYTCEASRLPDGRIRITIDPHNGSTSTGPDYVSTVQAHEDVRYVLVWLSNGFRYTHLFSRTLTTAQEEAELLAHHARRVWVLEVQDAY